MSSGITAEPISFVYNFSGVLIGMTHVMMPFIVFPLYASYKDLDYSLIEAAESLGSKSLQITKRIILPLTMPGYCRIDNCIYELNWLLHYTRPNGWTWPDNDCHVN